jgi:pyridoxal phosphate enzyme (YggS family)
MAEPAARIAENVARVQGRIAAAAIRSGRTARDVALVAVTKYVSADLVRPLVAAGCCDLGESRPQQLWEKAAALVDLPIRWHLIGHLQRNKVRRTIPLVTMIHSIDSERLLQAVGEESPCLVPVLLEVNVSGEAAKGGFTPERVASQLEQLAGIRNIRIRGLMCMAGLEGDLAAARRDFAALRQLRDRLRAACPAGASLNELSMGMSGDYEVAIEEGATIVRVGSALFEGVA